MPQIETRNERGDVRYHQTAKEGLAAAKEDPTIYRMTLTIERERVILSRTGFWIVEEFEGVFDA